MVNYKHMRASCRVILILTLYGVSFVVAQAQNKSLDYKIWKVFSEDTKGFTIVVISVNPKSFNREAMTLLAAKLNGEFAQKQKLKVGLLDDANSARLFVSGHLELPDLNRAQKGLYYLDRIKCKEYIQFGARNNSRNETIRLRCSQGNSR
jgi:hypothetical protein